MQKNRFEKLLGIFFLFLLLFNYPFVGLFQKSVLFFGIPPLYLYLFFAWFVMIALTYWIIERKNK